jgi:signal transduction histidine kinase
MTAVVVWEDISAAREVERLRAEWNSVVAHDLRQPINTINLYAQLLARAADQGRREGKSGPWLAEAVGHVAEIRRMIARLTRMTNDLLDLSRLDASRLTVQRRPFDVAAGVRGSVSHASLGSPERAFEVETDADLPEVEADPDRIAQVLENLLSNALKYGRSDAPVRVAVRRAGDGVSVAVTSQGAGLDAKDLERIFEKFQRAGVAAHRAIPGIGLGLQITQGLVHAHGGSITATSSASGETTFRFTLPRG